MPDIILEAEETLVDWTSKATKEDLATAITAASEKLVEDAAAGVGADPLAPSLARPMVGIRTEAVSLWASGAELHEAEPLYLKDASVEWSRGKLGEAGFIRGWVRRKDGARIIELDDGTIMEESDPSFEALWSPGCG